MNCQLQNGRMALAPLVSVFVNLCWALNLSRVHGLNEKQDLNAETFLLDFNLMMIIKTNFMSVQVEVHVVDSE